MLALWLQLSSTPGGAYRSRMHPYFDVTRPHLFAHRGASGLAPENTLVAFERARAAGLVYLEMDCHATADGEIVICHDPTLERTTNGRGLIREHRFAELEQLDAGYRFSSDGIRFPFRDTGVRIPRLSEVLTQLPNVRINLEIKQADPPVVDLVVDLLRRHDACQRTLLAAEEDSILDEIRSSAAGTALGSSREDVMLFYAALDAGKIDAFEPRGHALQIPPRALGRELITPEMLEAARQLGLFVHVWTINDPREIRALLASGVDGVMSDFPQYLLEATRAS